MVVSGEFRCVVDVCSKCIMSGACSEDDVKVFVVTSWFDGNPSDHADGLAVLKEFDGGSFFVFLFLCKSSKRKNNDARVDPKGFNTQQIW